MFYFNCSRVAIVFRRSDRLRRRWLGARRREFACRAGLELPKRGDVERRHIGCHGRLRRRLEEQHLAAEPVAGMPKAAPASRAAPPGPRTAAPPPKPIAEGKSAPANAPKKEPPEKSGAEHDDGKDKEQH